MVEFSSQMNEWVDERLRTDLIAWLSTAGPDGKPHSVPVWFWWDGATILIFSEPENRKIRNLRHQPAVVLALDSRDDGEEIVILEGTAELLPGATPELMSDGYARKYDHLFPRIDSSPSVMAEKYSLAIRITPTKLRAGRDEPAVGG